MVNLLKKTLHEWRKDKASLYAASITFYAIIAIAPLLVIVIAVSGMLFGEQAIQGEIVGKIQYLVGPEIAGAIESIIENATLSGSSTLFTAISIMIFLYAATRVFVQLKIALNVIWDIKHHPLKKLKPIIKSRLISLLLVLAFGFLIILSLILSGVIATAGVYLANIIPFHIYVYQVLNAGVGFILVMFIFALIYRYLPNVKISWRDVILGSAVTTVLFVFGNFLIGLYMRNVSVGSIYGAAGSFIIVLLWIYYCAQIFFIGAEFTYVYAKEYGSYSSKIKKIWHVLLGR